jgi:hypothetical protein
MRAAGFACRPFFIPDDGRDSGKVSTKVAPAMPGKSAETRRNSAPGLAV